MALPNGNALPNEDYANNKRTVTSSTSVLDTDSLLNVNTTSGAITITLKEIPTRFSTMYSLYIKDIGAYAATNNITITAPTGFKINGQQSVVIDTNRASCQIIITSNTDYTCNGLQSAVVGVQDFDTGWVNLTGFGHMTSPPQYRVIDRLIQFRGIAAIPLSNGSSVIPYYSENSYINSVFNAPWTGGGTGSVGLYFTYNGATPVRSIIIGFNGSGASNNANTMLDSLTSAINNSNRNPDNAYAKYDMYMWRRVQAQSDTTHGIVYRVPIELVVQTNGSIYISLIDNNEDGNWANFDFTDSRRILGTNAVAGQYYSDLSGLNAGNAAASSDVITKGISSPSYKHAITVNIMDVTTLGGFQFSLDGFSAVISRLTPLTTIHP